MELFVATTNSRDQRSVCSGIVALNENLLSDVQLNLPLLDKPALTTVNRLLDVGDFE